MLPPSDCWVWLPLETEEPDDVELVELEDVDPVGAVALALGAADAAAAVVEPVVDPLVVSLLDADAVSAWLTPNPNNANVPHSDNATAAAAIRARVNRLRARDRLLMQEGWWLPLSAP